MEIGDGAYHGEAQPKALALARAFPLGQRGQDLGGLGGRDARTLICDRETKTIHTQHDLLLGRAMAKRILDQVRNKLYQQVLIAMHCGRVFNVRMEPLTCV